MSRLRSSCLSLALLALTLGGCSTTSTPSRLHDGAGDQVALGTLGSGQGSAVRLGAGDALGRELFTYYVASLGLDDGPYYATGESEFGE